MDLFYNNCIINSWFLCVIVDFERCMMKHVCSTFCCSEDGDVDITGFDDTGASFCINETIYEVKNDSVIMKEDADKYGGTSDESDNESSYSSDLDEMTWR